MQIDQKLKKILEKTKSTQQLLANDLGVTLATLSSWLHTRSVPRQKKIQQIEKLYQTYVLGKIDTSSLENDKKEFYEYIKQFNISELLKRRDLTNNLLLALTYHTNKLEGSTITEPEAQAILFENKTFSNRTLVEHLEAKNHATAFSAVLQVNRKSIDSGYICDLHKVLMNGILEDAGLYRNYNVRIVGTFVPTTNHASINNKISEFILEHNRQDGDIVRLLARTHALFESIHPFGDGNGRIGRLLMAQKALSCEVLPPIIDSLLRTQYLKTLQSAQLDQDYTALEAVILSALKKAYGFIA